MVEVYLSNNRDFESNGDMTLTPTLCEVELTLEGVAELTLKHTIDELGRWKYLVQDNVIAAPTPYSEKQLFRIYDKTKNEDEVTVSARHIFYDSSGDMLLDVRPTDKTGQEALNIILAKSGYKARSNIKTRSTAYYVRKNIMEAIAGDDENSFINRWGGERMYDNFTIVINDRLGGDYGACAEFGYNASGIEEDINIDDIVTRIIPVAYNGITLDGEAPWVDSPLIGKYAKIRAAVVKFEDVKLLEDCQDGEEGFSTKELLQKELIRRCEKEFENGLDKPKVNYSVDILELSKIDQYKDYKILESIGIGDDVRTRNRGIEIDVMARCIRLLYDCLERVNIEVELGNFKENYFDKTTSAADIIHQVTREDGTLKAEEVYGTIDAINARLKAQRDISQPLEVRAVLFEDMVEGSPTFGAMSLGTMGFCIAEERTADGKDWEWKTFGTGSGFYADYICAGEFNGALIKANSIQAESISIEYKKSVEDHLSEAVKESERNYQNTVDKLVSGFKETYTTFDYVDQTAAGLAAEAEGAANTATDEKLKKYSTTVDIGTQIQQTAEAIKQEASKTYTTFFYVDETAGTLAAEAEDAANAATDEKLKKYTVTVDMNTAINQAAEEVKIYATKEINSARHDYVLNGSFSNGNIDNWRTSYTDNVAAKTVSGIGSVVELSKPSTTAVSIYQYWKLKAGKYKVRFKAAAETGAEYTARVRVSFNGVSYYTPISNGLKSTELTQFETEVNVTTDGTKYLYIYPYVTGKTVYVTDVEVLGRYEDYAESNFSVMSDAITAEVTRATGKEDTLKSSIEANATNINLKVSKGNVSSQIGVESGTVSIRSNRMIIDSDSFKLSGSGSATTKGTFTAESGKYKSVQKSGEVEFYYDNAITGQIYGSVRATNGNGAAGKVLDIECNQKGTIFSIGSTYYYTLNNGLNTYGKSNRHIIGGTCYFGDTIDVSKIRWGNNMSTYMKYGTLNGEGGMYSYASIYAEGQLACGGTKYRIVDTKNYGKIGMNAVESTGAYFTDIGSGKIIEGNEIYIFFDAVFMETIDTYHEYTVNITQTSKENVKYVEKKKGYFVVNGETGATFDWQIIAKQKDYAQDYMERVDIQVKEEIDYDESIFYGEEIAETETQKYMKELETDWDELARLYLEEYESEVNYD